MKFIKLHKQLILTLSVLLILFILTIISIDVFKSDDNKKDTHTSCDIAILSSKVLDEEYFSQIETSVSNIAKSLDKSYKTFSLSDYDNSYDKILEAAVESKASLVVLPDSSYEETMYNYQSTYVNTYFILIDGIPHNSDSTDNTINYNVHSLVYDKSDSSFLAGYAAVYEGYEHLNFICDTTDTQALQYCYGFLQGADYAAAQINNPNVKVNISYSSDNSNLAYTVPIDTDIIATASDSIIKELEQDTSISQIPIIDCDSCNLNSERIVLSASINLSPLIEYKILSFYNNDKKDGGTLTLKNALEYEISLNYNTSVFTKFNDEVYKKILTSVNNQEVSIISDISIPIDELELSHISVTDNKS